MRKHVLSHALTAMAALGVAAAFPIAASANAEIIIVNVDGAGEGFNDPTPAAPVGGNAGTTIGEQRLIAFQHAADLWGATLDSSVPIRIRAAFNPLSCTATAATLGSAGPIYVFKNYPGAPVQEVYYHEALANKLARTDLNPPGTAGDAANGADLNAQFNSNLGNTNCLTGTFWYYGLDTNHGTNIDLVTVLLHEFGHGLGFSSLVNRVASQSTPAGAYLVGNPGTYDLFIHDNTTNKDWIDMTDAERAASLKNIRNVAWTGVTVTGNVPSVLSLGTPLMWVTAPANIAGIYQVGTASFGPLLDSTGVSGQVAAALDAANASGPTTFDACTAITNPADVAGKIALVNRGTCGFAVKAANVQAAGAIAMVVADNVAGGPPPGMSGTDPTVTIPAVRITLADGNLLRTNLGSGVQVTLGLDPTRYSGADANGRVLLNTPDPVVSGSSVSHWDPLTFRNQLMEPAINGDLTHSVNVPEDLTRSQMRDIGWFPDADLDGVNDETDACLGSTLGGTVVIDSCDSGVNNAFFANGCSIADKIDDCAEAAITHEGFTACTTQYTNGLKSLGVINNKEKSKIQACAGKADIP